MRGRQSFATFVEGRSGEQAGILGVRSCSPIDTVLGENSLDLVPKGLVHDGLMLSGIRASFVGDLATIDAVLQHEIEGAAGQFLAAIPGAV